MKKLVIALFALAAVSFAAAQNFTVGAVYNGDLAATVEYGQEFSSGELLVGVAVVPLSWETEVTLGARAELFELTGGADLTVLAVSGRVHLPVYDGASFVIGQLDASVMVDLMVPQEQNGTVLMFSVGARAPVTTAGLTTLPSLVFGASLQF